MIKNLRDAKIQLTKFSLSDLPLLRRWLVSDHVETWYPNSQADLEWAAAPPANAGQRLIKFEDVVVGYIRWNIVTGEDLTAIGLHDVPHGSADVDIIVGERKYTSRGIGPAALNLLVDMFKARNDIPLVGLTTSVENYPVYTL